MDSTTATPLSFARIEACAIGWHIDATSWRPRRLAEGYSEIEIAEALVLAKARSEMRSSLYQTRGDPAYGGGGYSIELIDEEIVKSAARGRLYPGHPYIAAAAVLALRANEPEGGRA